MLVKIRIYHSTLIRTPKAIQMVSKLEKTLIFNSLTSNRSRGLSLGETDLNLLKNLSSFSFFFLSSFVLSPQLTLVDGMTQYGMQEKVIFSIMSFNIDQIFKNLKYPKPPTCKSLPIYPPCPFFFFFS